MGIEAVQSDVSGGSQSHDADLTAGGLCGGCDESIHPADAGKPDPVKFVDDHQNPRGRGRLDLATGERIF